MADLAARAAPLRVARHCQVVQVKRGFLVSVAAPRMATLDGLLELLGIAEKHHVSGGGAGRRFRPLQRWMMGLYGRGEP